MLRDRGSIPRTSTNNQIMSKPNKYFWLLIWPVFFFLLNFSGCATIATKEPYPSYNLNGVQYLPLRTLCEVKNIDLQYDAFANTVTLNKDNHRIALLVGIISCWLTAAPNT